MKITISKEKEKVEKRLEEYEVNKHFFSFFFLILI